MKDENKLKKIVVKSGAIFLGVMLILTIISKTIYAMLLPEVTLEKVRSGEITTTLLEDGQLGYDKLMINQMKVPVKAVQQGTITNCYVKENQVVKKDEVLFSIACDIDEDKRSQDEMQSKESEINKQSYEREKQEYTAEYSKLKEKLSQKEQKLNNHDKSYEVIEIENQIKNKKKEIAVNEQLYKAGSISQNEIDQAKEAIGLLEERKTSLIKEEKEKLNDEIEEIKDKMEEVQKQILDQNVKIKLEVNKLSAMRSTEDQVNVTSPINGVVYEISIATGAKAMVGDQLMVIVPEDIPITINFDVNEKDADKVSLDKEVEWTYNEQKKTAQIMKKTYVEASKLTTITCKVEQALATQIISDYKSYKNVDVEIKDKSEIYRALVPTSGVSYEGNKAFVYSIEEQDTIFEKKYIVHKNPVMVIEEGNYYCAIEGMEVENQVVATTSKELKDNTEVKVYH